MNKRLKSGLFRGGGPSRAGSRQGNDSRLVKKINGPPTDEQRVSSGDRPPRLTPVAFRFHARVVAALGRDLVTNDVVAVMELVKNSYDALASSVDVRIRNGSGNGRPSCIEVNDDGHGMNYATIRDVWCVIATPFRRDQPVSQRGSLTRSVTGEKGLGRLAAARLGESVKVITRAEGEPVLRFTLNWDKLLESGNLGDAAFEVSELPATALNTQHGTRVSINGVRSDWDSEKIDELRRHLARLVSPFGSTADFSIRVLVEDGQEPSDVRPISPPSFMSKPRYAIEGKVDEQGDIVAVYRYRPIKEGAARDAEIRGQWASVHAPEAGPSPPRTNRPVFECGPVQFEIRAWDLTQNDTRDIAEHFSETRSYIRNAIKSQQGISLYRDDVLVLPKSDSARDWLDLDLRRVSRVGTRLSTNQIVGSVRITKSGNPRILDTSDREGLVSNTASVAFRDRMGRIVALLEMERDIDRIKHTGHTTICSRI